jgi:hypothetical protein
VHLADSGPLKVGPVDYTAKVVGQIQFEAGGVLEGKIPHGKQLFLLWQPDSASFDSTPARNPGNGMYYLDNAFIVAGNCWFRLQGPIAYDGANGLIFRMHLVLVDDNQVANFKSKTRDGCDDEALNSLGVTRLAYFPVPT